MVQYHDVKNFILENLIQIICFLTKYLWDNEPLDDNKLSLIEPLNLARKFSKWIFI
jgi:hypothetical protein